MSKIKSPNNLEIIEIDESKYKTPDTIFDLKRLKDHEPPRNKFKQPGFWISVGIMILFFTAIVKANPNIYLVFAMNLCQ